MLTEFAQRPGRPMWRSPGVNLGSLCRLGQKPPGSQSTRQRILHAGPGPGVLQLCDDPHFSAKQEEVAQTDDLCVLPMGSRKVRAAGPRLVGEAQRVSAHTQRWGTLGGAWSMWGGQA